MILKIGEFSKLTRISIQMLRHYDEIGLLKPIEVNQENGYRYYDLEQLPIANRILSMKETGLGLSDIKNILEENNPLIYKSKLEEHKKQLENEVDFLKYKLVITKNILEKIESAPDVYLYDISVKEIPALNVIAYRGIIKSYDKEGELWEKLFENMNQYSLNLAVPSYFIAVFNDKYYKEDKIDVEVQCAVLVDNIKRNNILLKKREAVKVASLTFKGSYEKLYEINTVIADWITKNGYSFYEPEFNIYHLSPNKISNPKKYITEVCYPIV